MTTPKLEAHKRINEQVIKLYDEGHSYKAISALIGISVEAVRGRIHRHREPKQCEKCDRSLTKSGNAKLCIYCSEEVDRRIARLLDTGDEYQPTRDEIGEIVGLTRQAVYQRICRMKKRKNKNG